jgi:hypothetical protein
VTWAARSKLAETLVTLEGTMKRRAIDALASASACFSALAGVSALAGCQAGRWPWARGQRAPPKS